MSEEATTAAVESAPEVAISDAPATEPARQPAQPEKPKYGYWWGTGRRKAAVARARIKAGEGKLLINGRSVEEYLNEPQHKAAVSAPLEVTKSGAALDVFVNVKGGGPTGQAEATRLGIARALKAMDPSHEEVLREHGYLTVDARRVERKKYGQPGARRRFQFSKR